MKLPPHDPDSEEAVIGSLLIDGQLIDHIRDIEPEDFYYEPNVIMFRAMVALRDKGVSVNQITVARELEERGKLEQVGGAAHLSHLISICPTSIDYQDYANIVHRLALYRGIINISDQMAAIGYDGKKNISEALAQADNYILSLRQNVGGTHIITPKQRLDMAMDRYQKLFETQGGAAIPTGLLDLDKKLGGGLYAGELTVVAGRPSMGKTAMLECISNHISLNHPVLFCSGEMTVDSLTDRDMAGLMGMNIDDIRMGGYDMETYSEIVAKLPELAKYNIVHMEASRGFNLNTSNIYQTAYEMQVREGLALLVIDYLGLLTDKYGQNNNERLGYITQQLKQTALALKIPILLAHQLSRAPEMRPDKHPQLSDLRESGRIEEDADNVLFLYRENYYDPNTENNLTEILIAKHRQGGEKVGKGVRVIWDYKYQTYRNLVKQEKKEENTSRLI